MIFISEQPYYKYNFEIYVHIHDLKYNIKYLNRTLSNIFNPDLIFNPLSA